MWLFSDFQYDFRSSHSTAVCLTSVSDRITSAFSRSAAMQAGLDIFNNLACLSFLQT